MSDLRDPLDDLLAEIPAYVVPDARAAWAAGARRRTRHRVAVVAGAAVVNPLLDRELSGAPGPMAVVYQRNSEDVFGWWVADERGRTWQVPQTDLIDDYPPALSPDGRLLGYLSTQDTYVVHDLVSGEENGF